MFSVHFFVKMFSEWQQDTFGDICVGYSGTQEEKETMWTFRRHDGWHPDENEHRWKKLQYSLFKFFLFILVLLIKTNQTVQGQKRWLLCKHCVYIHEWGFGETFTLYKQQQQQQTVHT